MSLSPHLTWMIRLSKKGQMLADTWWTCGPLPSAAPEATSVWVERQSEVVPSHILTPEYQHVLSIGQGVHQPPHRRDFVEATNG